MSGRKRKIYLNFHDKLTIIKSLQDGENVAALAKKYFVSKCKIYSIKKNQKTLSLEDCENDEDVTDYSVKLSTTEVKMNTEQRSPSPKWRRQSNDKAERDHTDDDTAVPSDNENEKMTLISTTESPFFQNKLLSPVKEENDAGGSILLVPNPPSFTEDHLESQEKATLILSSDPLVRMEELLSLEESSENVVCSSFKKFQEIVSNFETDTYTKYSITKTKGAFVEDDVPFMQRRVRWWEGGKLSGVPYIIVATRYFSCRYGAPIHSRVLENYAKKREEQHKLGLCKRYKVQGSKKVGCPVKFVAHRLLIFPDLQVHGNEACSKLEREEIKKSLKQNFKSFRFENRYTCVLPDTEAHRFHYTGPSSANKESMDDRILQKIKSLVAAGKTDPDDIAESVEDFAKVELKAGDKDRRRFFPSRLDIMHAINRAKLKIRFDPKEQETIKSLQSSWGTTDEVFLRPMKLTKDGYLEKEHPDSSSRFLFVYQNRQMKRLYRLYGGNAVFLDAVHRTCEYAWPFYLLIVNTNSNYQVVGFFVTQHESKITIAEGLHVIKAWNPSVCPKYAIVNRPWEEIKALEAVYPDARTFVSAYHRDRAWRKKIARRENDGLNRDEVLSRLRQVVEATTEKDLRSAIAQLKDNESYNSSTIKTYYESSWHLQLKRWVAVHKPQDLLFDANDGVQRLEEEVQYDYISQLKSKPLSVIINTLITRYIPFCLLSYRRENSKILRKYKSYQGIPTYLKVFSEWILDQVLVAHLEATEESDQYFVQYMSENGFMISYVGSNRFYEVRFEPVGKRVSCSCSFFAGKVICKHVIMVGLKFSEWHLSRISCWLFDNPVYKVDKEFQHNQNKTDIFEDVSIETDFECRSDFAKEDVKSSRPQHNVLTECKSELKALESLSCLMDESRVETLLCELKKIKENSQCLNPVEEYINSYVDQPDSRVLKDGITDHFVEHDTTELEEIVIEIDKLS